MCSLNEDFKTFIDERIYSKFSRLKNKKKYISINNTYKQEINNLRKNLSQEQQENLEKVLSLKDDLNSEEIFFCYTIGLTDGIKLNNHIN